MRGGEEVTGRMGQLRIVNETAFDWEPHRRDGSGVSKMERSRGSPVLHRVHAVVGCGEISGCCAMFIVVVESCLWQSGI
jgi:hypothetical protein